MQASLNGPLGNIPLTETALTIGRAADNRLALADPQSSSHHAEIRPVAQEYAIVDLNSTNGTFVNEQRLPPQVPRPLIPGDVIRIGAISLTYTADDASEATMRAGTNEYMNAGYAPTVAGPSPIVSPNYPPPSQPGYADYQSQPPPPAYGGYSPPSQPGYADYQSQQPPSSYGQPSQPGQPAQPAYSLPQSDYQAQSYPQPAYPPPPAYPQQPWNVAPGQAGIPSAQAQPPRKRRTGLIIGLAVLLLVIVVVAVGGFLYINRSTPEKTLTAYCTALQNNDAQGVFNQLSARAQSQTSVAKISQAMVQLNKPVVGGIKTCTFSNVQESGSTATANSRLVVGDTLVPPINSKVTLLYQNGTWKIDQDQSGPTPTATPTGL